MVKIALTFDDGRSDNYAIAKPIMDKFGLCGTVYVTTGYIDGSWSEYAVLGSPSRPLNLDEMLTLRNAGWEIGLHGDKHQTSVEDTRRALEKMSKWGLFENKIGISLPNSSAEELEIRKILSSEYGEKIEYVRRGRKCDTSKLRNKFLFAAYSLLGVSGAFDAFNRENSFALSGLDRAFVPSVVVRSNDRPDVILDYLKGLPSEAAVVFMLHSVLEPHHPRIGDPWCWGSDLFAGFCEGLYELQQQGMAEISTLMQMLSTRESD